MIYATILLFLQRVKVAYMTLSLGLLGLHVSLNPDSIFSGLPSRRELAKNLSLWNVLQMKPNPGGFDKAE